LNWQRSDPEMKTVYIRRIGDRRQEQRMVGCDTWRTCDCNEEIVVHADHNGLASARATNQVALETQDGCGREYGMGPFRHVLV
jgi:hypothetical protein